MAGFLGMNNTSMAPMPMERMNGTLRANPPVDDGGDMPMLSADDAFVMDCFSPYMIITNGLWLGVNPLRYSLLLFLMQLLIITLTSRALYAVLKPLRQPMVLAEILAGVLLGPSFMGRIFTKYQILFFPARSISMLASVSNLGLLYFIFMVGVEMDIKVLKIMRKKSITIGTVSILFPLAITLPFCYLFHHLFVLEQHHNHAFYIYLALALSITGFPVLTRILGELKLMNSEIGRVSLLSSLVNHLLTWVLAYLVVTITKTAHIPFTLNLLASLGFVLVCIFLVRPALERLVRRTPKGELMSDIDLGIVIMGVMVAGLVADFIGINHVFGAFVYGLIFPHGPHGGSMVKRLEFFMTGLLLPIYFASSGFKADFSRIERLDAVAILFFLFVLASVAKVGATTLISMCFGMRLPEGISLGILMGSQGLVELILINVARDADMISPEIYAILLLLSVMMTALVTPLVMTTYRRTKQQLVKYKRRTLMGAKPQAELRMLACVHSSTNVPSVINLLDMSNPTKKSPIFVSALHLVELTGWASAMHVVHEAGSKSSTTTTTTTSKGTLGQSKNIVAAFETYEQHAGGVSFQAVTVVSPYSEMHEDICTLAANKHAAIIILPFEKIKTINGSIESDNLAVRSINQNVLEHAPCSVAILVERGLSNGRASLYSARRVMVLFFGGPDDREALAYASRMAEHPSISLTMVRFIHRDEATAPPRHLPPSSETNEHSSMIEVKFLEANPDLVLDEECISEFRLKNLRNESFEYVERVLNSSEETVAAIRGMESSHDLCVVGRSQGNSPLSAGLMEWTEHAELGPIGDLLVTDLEETLSVLVVQQYKEAGNDGGSEKVSTVKVDNPEKWVEQA